MTDLGALGVIASQIAEQPALLEAVKGALLSRESLILKLSASFMWNYSLSGCTCYAIACR